MNVAPRIFLLLLLLIGIAAADLGNSSTYRLAVQENNFNIERGNSTSFDIAVDSGSAGVGNSTTYRVYSGYASFLAKFGAANVTNPPLVNLTSFAGEAVVYQDTTARFQITVKNDGNVASTIVPRLYIYNSAGSLAFERTGTSTTLGAGATVSLLQYSTLIFSVGTIATGTYNATVNILYTDENNVTQVTQNKSVLFEIRAVSTTTTTTTTTTSPVQFVPEIGPEPKPEAEEINYIEFVSVPALIRIEASQDHEATIQIINPGEKKITNLKLSAEGAPEGWIWLSEETIDIDSGEEKQISMFISVPGDAEPRDYIVKIKASNEITQSSSFILRVTAKLQLSTPEGEILPESISINRFAYIDTKKKETHFRLAVKSVNTYAEKIVVVERIDKLIAESADEIAFLTLPSRIVEQDPVVEWTLSNVKKNEERNITYYVRKVVNKTQAYAYPSVEQVALFQAEETDKQLEFKVDQGTVNTILLLALAAAGIFVMYRLEHRIRKKIYAKGIRRFIGKPILTAETGLKLGIVDDITFMPETGEILDIVVKKPTMYARRLIVKRGVKNRLYVPFQSVKGLGDYVVITERDIVFEAVLKKRLAPETEEQTKITRFYKPSGIIKVRPSEIIATEKPKEKPIVQYTPYSGFNLYNIQKPASIRAHLKELKKLYREGVIDKKTYRSTKKRLLEGLDIVKIGEPESVIEKLKNKISILVH